MGKVFYPKFIISGGQTGADRGALYAAKQLGYEHGGWVTLGRRAEDGQVPSCFPMTECSSTRYPERTRLNVECSDATLLFGYESPSGGTALTIRIAEETGRDYLFVEIHPGESDRSISDNVRKWLADVRPRVLNVAGQRESHAEGIQKHVTRIMSLALQKPSQCICGRNIPEHLLVVDKPLRCASCGHLTCKDDFEL